jgi:hypothetical protein
MLSSFICSIETELLPLVFSPVLYQQLGMPSVIALLPSAYSPTATAHSTLHYTILYYTRTVVHYLHIKRRVDGCSLTLKSRRGLMY